MQLKDYIKGNKRGKEANRMERDALNDPFLEEALTGFETVEGDHVEVIDRLEKRFTKPFAPPQKNKNIFLYGSIAASILLLIGFSGYFFLEKNKNSTQQVAMVQSKEKDIEISADAPYPQPVQAEDFRKESIPEEKIMKKELPSTQVSSSITPMMAENISQSEAELADTNQAVRSTLAETRAEIEQISEDYEKQTIRGKIIDETGEPLAGVSIVEKGTVNGTVSDANGVFSLDLSNDSAKLTANYLGYLSQEINPSETSQTVILKPDNHALSEVVVIGYGVQKRAKITGAVSNINKETGIQLAFGEKEFQTYCQQKANKNVCNQQDATVKLSFYIDEKGKPTEIEYKNYSCEDAKKEMEKLLSSSPVWTKTNRKVTMKVKW